MILNTHQRTLLHLGLPLVLANKNGGGSSAPPPDPAIGQAEKSMADTSAQEWDYYKNTLAPEQQQQQQFENNLASQQATAAMNLENQQTAQAKSYYDTYENTFLPTMKNMVNEANNYNSQANYNQQAQLAVGDVDSALNAQTAAQKQQMQSVGINPTSGAFQGMWNANGINQAAQEAAASTRARTAAQQLGWQMQDQAASLGQYLPNDSAMSAAAATNAGNSGTSAASAASQNTNAAASTNAQTGSSVGSIQQGMGQLGNASYQTQVNAWNDQQQQQANSASGLGGLLGTATGFLSSPASGTVGAAALSML